MLFRSEDSKNCLFCNEECNSEGFDSEEDNDNDDLGDGTGEKCSCHSHPCRFLGSLPFKWEDNKIFQAHLKYAFVLRKLLDYPRGKCVQYLRQRCLRDAEVDDGWFSVCPRCSELLEQGHGIYHKIEALESQLNELKQNLKETIVEAHNLNDSFRDEKKEGKVSDNTIHTEVLNHFAQNSWSSPDNDLDEPFPDQSIVKTEVPGSPEDSDESNEETENDDDSVTAAEDNDWVPDSASESEDADEENSEINDKDGSDVKPLVLNANDSQDKDKVIDEAEFFKGKTLRRPIGKRKGLEFVEEKRPEFSAKRPKEMQDKEVHGNNDLASESDDEGGAKSDESSYLRCSICCAEYLTKHRLREHENLHSLEDGVLKCTECPFVCQTERGQLMHKNKMHSGDQSDDWVMSKPKGKRRKPKSADIEEFCCSTCGTTYKTVRRLKEHEELHYRDDVLKCDSCEYVCLAERGMKIHVTKSHKTGNEEKEEVVDSRDVDVKPKPFCCKICCASFNDRGRLQEHKLLHKSKEALKCSMCPYVCQTRRTLKIHIGRVHGKDKIVKKGPFNCTICPAVYQTTHRFREHMYLHKGSSSNSCRFCGWVFSSKEKCDRHEDLRHRKRVKKSSKRRNRNIGESFQCEHCPAFYRDRYRFKEHVHVYHEDKLLACDLCQQYYESKRILDDHRKKCKGPSNNDGDIDPLKRYECQHCDKIFTIKYKFKRHVELEHSKDRFECLYCDVIFPTETKRRFHMSRKHEDLHNVCVKCGYKAHGAAQLGLHMQKHTKEKKYMCEICSKTFVSPTYLTAHKQKIHYEELGVTPLMCDKCDMILPTKSMLKYHIKKVHEKEFKYSCDVCGKGFLFASSLRNHSAVHSTERNQICPYCGAAYVHNRVLMDHLKNHHPEEYASAKGIDPSKVPQPSIHTQGPFFCKFCHKEFAMRWTLFSHLRTHTEVYEKYKCEICGRGYSSQAGLKRHEESAHKEESFACENCGKDFSCRDYLRYHIKNHCKKKGGPGNEEASSSMNVEDEAPVIKHGQTDTDPHVVKEAGQLHIVKTSSLAPNHLEKKPPDSDDLRIIFN